MKKLFALTVIIFLAAAFFFWQHNTHPAALKNSAQESSFQAPAVSPRRLLFVPYWTMGKSVFPSRYDTVAYFGVSATGSGIDMSDDGYKGLPQFVSLVGKTQKKLLTVELLDQATDEKILHDSVLQQKVMAGAVGIAGRYGFDGIVLDEEYHALAFDEVVKGVTDFSTKFAKASQNSHLLFYQAFNGDTFYRLRPYDINAIGKASNGILVMAYDFHKATGNPGPNFPLTTLADEDYNFFQMVNDFTGKVSAAKLTVVFGMFGYDWTVNAQGQSVGEAQSLTTNQMQQKFTAHCLFSQCAVTQNNAHETEITYEDAKNQKHVVWFEDLTSVAKKEAVLKAKGITSEGFWAYSYF